MFVRVEHTQSQTSMRLRWAKSDFPRPSKDLLPRKVRQKSGQGQHAWAPWLSPDVDLWASNFSCTKWGGACALLAILKMICVSDAWTLKHCVSLSKF